MTNRSITNHVRDLLSSMLKKHVKDKAEREKLAGILGQSVSNVKNMLYRGEGSMDSWVTAISHYYGFNIENFDNISKAIMKSKPATASDNIYFELSEKLPPDRLYYFMCLLRAAVDIEEDLKKKKVHHPRNLSDSKNAK